MKPILPVFLLLLLHTAFSQPIQDLKICPERITTNVLESTKDDCANPFVGKYNIINPGTTLYLEEQVVENREEYGYYCACKYEIRKEDRMIFQCNTDTELEASGNRSFDIVFTLRWLDQDFVPDDCDVFEINYPPRILDDENYYKVGDADKALNFESKKYQAPLSVPWTAEHIFTQASSAWELLKSRSLDRDCQEEEEEISIEIIDVNPKYITGGFLDDLPSKQVKELEAKDLIRLTEARKGVSMDSVSQVLIRFETDSSKTIVVEADTDAGTFDLLWGDQTHQVNAGHYGFILYTPPAEAPQESTDTMIERIMTSKFSYSIRLSDRSGSNEHEQDLILFPPPVVLVHGTFDNPENCWRTPPFSSGTSMVDRLESAGYKVFTVDYSTTNGLGRLPEVCPSSFLYNSSCFETNKQVVFKNPGGIRDALDFYRDSLDVATTRVDVIGHSMGGVLARVYASENYEVNPFDISERDYHYQRADNFMKGDINRLITISSTHHGSDMAWYLYLLDQESVNDTLPFIADTLNFETLKQLDNAALLSTAQLGVIWLLEGIRPDAGAIEDQIPGSPALRKIGSTPIPAHSIVTVVDTIHETIDNPVDPDHSYYNRALFSAMVFYFSPAFFDYVIHQVADEWHKLPEHLKKDESRVYKGIDRMYLDMYKDDREAFKNLYKDPLQKQWQSFLKLNDMIKETVSDTLLPFDLGYVGLTEFDDDLLDYLTGGNLDNIKLAVDVGFKLKELANFMEFVDRIRYLIFKNDKNDFTVRYDSQIGFDNILDPPDERYYTLFSNSLHSFTPRYPDIQDHIVRILGSGLDYFNSEGFPPAGRKLPIWLPDPGDQADDITGCEAICWSGYEPADAREFAQIAHDEHVVLLARPVNPDATPLIANNRATKGMPIKGKSSNWGPHKGLLAVDQRYSKLWKLYTGNKRAEQITKFNGKVNDLLEKSPGLVTKAHLNDLTFDCGGGIAEYEMYVVKQQFRSDAETEIRLRKKGSNEIFQWDPGGPETCPLTPCLVNCTVNELDTFFVQANPDPALLTANGEPPLYTADYDLLSIGFFDARLFQNPNATYEPPVFNAADWDCERGFITAKQKELLDKINAGIKNNACYTAGNVVHHGPENHFVKITLANFDCDPGEVKSIEIPGSPYIDYPVTAFEPHPDLRFGTTGIIRSIPMGPPGYRDIHLKEYFHRMRIRGFDLYANPAAPGWQWEYYRPYSYEQGFDPRDAPTLPQSVSQVPRPKPEKCNCNTQRLCNNNQYAALAHINSLTDDLGWSVFPNPASDVLNISMTSSMSREAHFVLVDPWGKIVDQLDISLLQGPNHFQWLLSELRSGMYFLRCITPDTLLIKSIIVE